MKHGDLHTDTKRCSRCLRNTNTDCVDGTWRLLQLHRTLGLLLTTLISIIVRCFTTERLTQMIMMMIMMTMMMMMMCA